MRGKKRVVRESRSTAAGLLVPALLALAGCRVFGWNAAGFARAWDDFRCDRRVAVIENLRLDTTGGGDATSTSPAAYNRALAYFHSRGVSEVIFVGRTTAHGSIAEFRALNAGFSSIPDPAYKTGHATITWTVPRTYRFAPEDAQGKYHPRIFWPRIFNATWSDDFIQCGEPATLPLLPRFLVWNYYGFRCLVQEVAFLTHDDVETFTNAKTSSWDVIREWETGGKSEEVR